MTTTSPMTFAQTLKRYRVAAGLTQEELAERSVLSARAISDLERGARVRPRRETIDALARGLHLSREERRTLEDAAFHKRNALQDRVPASVANGPLPVGGFLGALPEGPLAARDDELLQMRAILNAVERGTGRAVLLVGEPGVGKTRLAQEVTVEARARGFAVTLGRCYEPYQGIPFYPFLDALNALHENLPPALQVEALQRWPSLTGLFNHETHEPRTPWFETHEEQHRLFRAVAGFISWVAELQPCAMLLDDLHWADTASLLLLQHLARNTRISRVLLLGTYRKVEVPRGHPLESILLDLTRDQLITRIPLRRLTREGTEALVTVTLGQGDVPRNLAVYVHDRTDGNPFFTREVLRDLMDRGALVQQDGRWIHTTSDETVVPESIRALILQRLARLSEGAQAILSESSVLGQTFLFDDLVRVGERREDAVEEALEEARAAGLVREVSGNRYGFNHALTQQALYAELAPRRRRRLHLAVAQVAESLPLPQRKSRAAEIAWHFLEADDLERALQYEVMAGDQAEAVFAHEDAMRHYNSAVTLAGDTGNRAREVEALEKQADTLTIMGRYDDALRVYDQVADSFHSENRLEDEARVVAEIGRLHANAGDIRQGVRRIEPVLAALERHGPSRSLGMLHVALGHLFRVTGRYADSLAAAEAGAAIAMELGDDKLLVQAEVRRGNALNMLGRWSEAQPVLEAVLAKARAVEDYDALHRALNNLGGVCRYLGELQQSKRYEESALTLAEQMRDPAPLAFQLATLSSTYVLLGEWERAESHLIRAVESARQYENSWYSAYALLVLGQLNTARGEWDAAMASLHRCVTIAERGRDLQALREAHGALAEIDLLSGLPEAVLPRLQPLLGQAGIAQKDILGLLWVVAAAHLKMDQVGAAEEVTALGVRQATASTHRLALVDLLRVRGTVHARRRLWPEAKNDFQASISLSRDMPYPYAEARALHEYGVMCDGMDSEQARSHLEEAAAIFRRLGARKCLERTLHALTDLR